MVRSSLYWALNSIAARLLPQVSTKQAKHAIDTLLSLGFFVRDEQGKIQRAYPVLSTGPEVRTLHAANYHRAMMSLASESIDRIPSSARDISSLTVCISPEEYEQIKRRIGALRREILEIAESTQSAHQVLQINFQLFPLSELPAAANKARTGE